MILRAARGILECMSAEVISMDTTEERLPEQRYRPPCADEDPELFFPVSEIRLVKGTRVITYAAQMALEVCAGCDLQARAECLDTALAHRYEGIWGGTTTDQRATMRRRAA